jgi:hypothetical protein
MGGFVGQTAAQFKFEEPNGVNGNSRHGAIDVDDETYVPGFFSVFFPLIVVLMNDHSLYEA